jgi:hypothetical protein
MLELLPDATQLILLLSFIEGNLAACLFCVIFSIVGFLILFIFTVDWLGRMISVLCRTLAVIVRGWPKDAAIAHLTEEEE